MKIFYILLILMGFMGSAAADIDNKPMLRLNTQMHTEGIRKMSIDAQQRFLVTGSHDKTARVWDLQSGKSLSVLRPPIGEGHEGKINAVAISPNGEIIAVGGSITSLTSSNSNIESKVIAVGTKEGNLVGVGDFTIYFFNRSTGQIIRVVV